MNKLDQLFRPAVRELQPYAAANYADGCLRLNANETPWRPSMDQSAAGLNRYPEVRPRRVSARLASHYGVHEDRLLVTRGSSEAIELIIRATCREGKDDIVICPPTFGMYGVYARAQGAGVVEVPLLRDANFAVDIPGIQSAWSDRCKLLFLCSPNNPTGQSIPASSLDEICAAYAGRALVVLDAAYIEFAAEDPTARLLAKHDNLLVLRTLSKALGLAGVRCGVALGHPRIIDLVGRILSPYSLSTPCSDAVLAALNEAAGRRQDIAALVAERERVAEALAANARIKRVWPSDGNFLLVEAADPQSIVADARAANILIRDFSTDPWTPGCLRITIATAEQNQQLLDALN